MDEQKLIRAKEALRDFFAHNDRLPSIGEFAKLLRYSSRSSAVYVINQLIELGFVDKGVNGKLVTTALFYDRIKLVGSVAAGFPTPEEEELVETVSLDDFLISNPNSAYMLEVKGDSMQDAGILPGDYVIVDKKKVAKSGDIVIAQVDNEWTMKYYRKKGSVVYLEPANKNYSNIYPEMELFIGGVVTSICRKY